jgi:uncharacterized protein (TIGR03083 family)
MFDHTSVIAAETERFAEAVTAADPGVTVPTCTDWTAADLLWHLTDVHAFWARILSSGALTDEDSEAVEQDKPARPDDPAETVALLRAETEALIDELDARPDDQPAWSWFGSDQTVGFTRKMQVHEAVMHRIDAELVAGRAVTPIDPEVAEAGIKHAVDVMFAWWGTLPGFTFTTDQGPVALTMTDRGRSILVHPGRWRGVGQSGTSYDEPGILRVTELPPVASFTGTAEQLDRWLWGRGDEPDADGDAAALDAVRAVQAGGIQ